MHPTLFSNSASDLALQKELLDKDLPLRVTVASAATLLTLAYLPIVVPVVALIGYLLAELAHNLLQHAFEKRGFRSKLLSALVLINSGLGMTCFILPPTLMWFEPGEATKLGTLLYIVGAFMSVTLVRPVYLQLAVVNSIPPMVTLLLILFDMSTRLPWNEMLFMTMTVSLLIAYVLAALLSNHRVQQELSAARDAALARVETQGRFLATMSHELRTPLNAILGLAQVLSDKPDASGDEADVIRDSARAMALLVGDLLDHAAIEAGALRIAPQAVDPAALVGTQLRLWQPRFAERGLSLDLRLPMAVPDLVLTDPTRLAQCLGNLLSNALRHTRVGGAVMEMTMTGDILDINVTDTGPGIAEEAETRLFRPYEKISPETAQPGGSTGLGLAISRGLARAMGGDLRYERPPGHGARFRLTLLAPRPTLPPVPPAALPERGLTPGLQGRHVLIVDDIATNRMVLRLLLSGLGVKSVEISSGREVLAALTATPFDAVLLDIRMPDLSGPETLKTLREAGHLLPVIAVSADADSGDQSRALAQGFAGYLVKPLEAARLESELVRVLARSQDDPAPPAA